MSQKGFSRSLRRLSLAALAGLAFALPASAQKNDLGLEAVIAPHFRKDFGSPARQAFGLDFYRVSSGTSLLALYGTGDGYTDFSAQLRLSGLKQFFGEPFSRGLVYGVGLGAAYSTGMDAARTGTAEKAAFVDFVVNPYVRYLFDINGWIGPYIEAGYEVTAHRLPVKAAHKPLDPSSGRFVVGFGIAFEVER